MNKKVKKTKAIKLKSKQTNKQDVISDALYKRAVGFEISDVVEEFSLEEENLKLIKKKITTKYVPPDITAAKALLSYYKETEDLLYENLTDEDLAKEKQRILNLIKSLAEEEKTAEEESDGS